MGSTAAKEGPIQGGGQSIHLQAERMAEWHGYRAFDAKGTAQLFVLVGQSGQATKRHEFGIDAVNRRRIEVRARRQRPIGRISSHGHARDLKRNKSSQCGAGQQNLMQLHAMPRETKDSDCQDQTFYLRQVKVLDAKSLFILRL